MKKELAVISGSFGVSLISVSLSALPHLILELQIISNNVSEYISSQNLQFFGLIIILLLMGVAFFLTGVFTDKKPAKLLGYLSMSLYGGVLIIMLFVIALSLIAVVIDQDFIFSTIFTLGIIASVALGFSANDLWKNYGEDEPVSKSKIIALSGFAILCCILISLIMWIKEISNVESSSMDVSLASMWFAASTIPYIIASLGFVMAIPASPKSSEFRFSSKVNLDKAYEVDQYLSSLPQGELTMYCRYCGRMIPADSVYCIYCGRRLR